MIVKPKIPDHLELGFFVNQDNISCYKTLKIRKELKENQLEPLQNHSLKSLKS